MTLRNIQPGDVVEVCGFDQAISGAIQEITEDGIAIVDTGQGTFEAHLEDCHLVRQDNEEEEND